MTQAFILLALLMVGLGNFVPVIGVVSGARLQPLYGLAITDPVLLMLMRHRALLFGILGGYVLASIVWPSWRMPALWLALFSMVGFVVLAGMDGLASAAIRRLVWIDLLLIVLAGAALALMHGQGQR